MSNDKIWTWDESDTHLDINIVTNLYLSGTVQTPAHYVDRLRSKAEYDALPVNSTGDKILTINLDAVSYMSDGPGRYASPSQAPIVEQFFNGQLTLENDVYTVAELQLPPHNISQESFEISVAQYQINYNDNDYEARTYIFNNSKFILSKDTEFIVTSTGVSMNNVKIRPFDDNFDFKTEGFFASLADQQVLGNSIDPYDLGVTLDFVFKNKDNIVAIPNYSYSSDVAQYSARDTDGSLLLNALPAMLNVVADLQEVGTIDYINEHDEQTLFGANEGLIYYGSAGDDVVEFSVSYVSPLLNQGIGNDIIVTNDGNDIIYGQGSGNDIIYAGDNAEEGDPENDTEQDIDTLTYQNLSSGVSVVVSNQGEEGTIYTERLEISNHHPSYFYKNFTDLAYGIENLKLTSSIDKVVFTEGSANGNYTIDGLGGKDILDFSGHGTGLTIDMNSGTVDMNSGTAGGITFEGFSQVIGSAQTDIFIDAPSANIYDGRGGQDSVTYNDTDVYYDVTVIDEDAGEYFVDTYVEGDHGSGVFFNSHTRDILHSIENLTGTGLNLYNIQNAGGTNISGTNDGESLGYTDITMANTFEALGGNDTVFGGNGNDRIIGGKGNDTLTGNMGADTYVYNKGHDDDIIWGDVGNYMDTLVLGPGISPLDVTLARYNHAGNVTVTIADSGTIIFTGQNQGHTIDFIEFLEDDTIWDMQGQLVTVYGTDGNDFLVGTTDYGHGREGSLINDVIRGEGGSDDIQGRSGDDKLYGGWGNDVIAGETGNDELFGEDGNDALYGNGEDDILRGGDGDDELYGGLGDDVLHGDDGNDMLYGEGGNDIYVFGTGKGSDVALETGGYDVLSLNIAATDEDGFFSRTGNDLYIDVGEGFTVTNYYLGAQSYWIEEIEFSDGSTFDLTTVFAREDTTYNGTSSAETFDGGVGNDTVNYGASLTAVNVDLENSTASGGDALGDILISIENLLGSNEATPRDYIWGDAFANRILGQSGNDILQGGAGADTIDGGDGWDYSNYTRSDAGVTVNLATNINVGGHAQGDVLTNIEAVIGSDYDDVLTGGSGNDYLKGGAGNDVLDGADGFDLLYGEAGNDVFHFASGTKIINETSGTDRLVFDAAWSPDQVSISDNYLSFIDASDSISFNDITLIEEFEFNNTGSSVIVALALLQTYNPEIIINGDANDNVFYGSENAETFNGAGGIDTVNYSNSALGVTVDLESGIGSGGDASGDIYNSIENVTGSDIANITGSNANDYRDWIWGDANDNVIKGLAGHDILEGGAGADTIDGGAGWDYARYLRSDVGVNINLSTGVHTGGHAEGDTLTGIEAIVGSNHNDNITGGSSNDYLSGSDGDDVLYGSFGADTLIGGSGADSFIFKAISAISNFDKINDFSTSENDNIDISDVIDLTYSDPTTQAITDFVQLTDDGTHTSLSVDIDGGGDNFVKIAEIRDVTGLDLQDLIDNTHLLVA